MKRRIYTLCSILLMLSFLAGCSNAGIQEVHGTTPSAEGTAEDSEMSTETSADKTEDESAADSTTEAVDDSTESSTDVNEETDSSSAEETEEETEASSDPETAPESTWVFFNPDGMTLQTRINTPEGYTRREVTDDSLDAFLRGYALKEHGAPVLLYNGGLKEDQTCHCAVFKLPIENEDHQQCADSVMRVYAEYYWHTGQQDKIAYTFTNGFYADWATWRAGNRIKVDGSSVYWVSGAGYDDSYENLKKYLRMIFCYAGTLSMDRYEATPISLEEMQVGDVFLFGGSPGHAVMVVDICYNEEGKKAFLLAQSHMPAQEFQLAKNPAHEWDPWYYEDEVVYPFETIEYIFPEGSLQRLTYWAGN